MVFYFTGTGNSLYVAKQFDPKPMSIPQVMRNEEREFIADSIGLIAPIYGHELPLMVKEFLKEADAYKLFLYNFDLRKPPWEEPRSWRKSFAIAVA